MKYVNMLKRIVTNSDKLSDRDKEFMSEGNLLRELLGSWTEKQRFWRDSVVPKLPGDEWAAVLKEAEASEDAFYSSANQDAYTVLRSLRQTGCITPRDYQFVIHNTTRLKAGAWSKAQLPWFLQVTQKVNRSATEAQYAQWQELIQGGRQTPGPRDQTNTDGEKGRGRADTGRCVIQ